MVEQFVSSCDWLQFLARDPATVSNTSVCLQVDGASGAQLAAMQRALEEEGVAVDIGSYRYVASASQLCKVSFIVPLPATQRRAPRPAPVVRRDRGRQRRTRPHALAGVGSRRGVSQGVAISL